MAYTDPAARFAEHSKPLTKVHKSTTGQPAETRESLLNKAAGCSDPMLVKGYQERARELPEPGPKLPADASAATEAMVEVLRSRAESTQSRELATGYYSRARTLRAWIDGR
jgi:hypothetical protein